MDGKRSPGRPLKPLRISPEQRAELERRVADPTASERVVLRARIVLQCGEGRSNAEVAEALNVHVTTVGKWRERFRRLGMEGLEDEPRPGAPRRIASERVEELLERTLHSTPAEGRWSRRSMARALGLSADTVGRIWRAFGLRPHVPGGAAEPTQNVALADAAERVLGLFVGPPCSTLVLSVDRNRFDMTERVRPLLTSDLGNTQLEEGAFEMQLLDSLGLGKTASDAPRPVIPRPAELRTFAEAVERAIPNGELNAVVSTEGCPSARRWIPWLVERPRWWVHVAASADVFRSLCADVLHRLEEGRLQGALSAHAAAHPGTPTSITWLAESMDDGWIGHAPAEAGRPLESSTVPREEGTPGGDEGPMGSLGGPGQSG